MVALLKRHGLKYFAFITWMVGCYAWSQEYFLGQIKHPVKRDDFEDTGCLISGRGFSYGLAHGKHDSCQFEDTYLYDTPVKKLSHHQLFC